MRRFLFLLMLLSAIKTQAQFGSSTTIQTPRGNITVPTPELNYHFPGYLGPRSIPLKKYDYTIVLKNDSLESGHGKIVLKKGLASLSVKNSDKQNKEYNILRNKPRKSISSTNMAPRSKAFQHSAILFGFSKHIEVQSICIQLHQNKKPSFIVRYKKETLDRSYHCLKKIYSQWSATTQKLRSRLIRENCLELLTSTIVYMIKENAQEKSRSINIERLFS